jgi:hypothetical protein
MIAERDMHIKNFPFDKANGFFERELGSSFGSIKIKVPRDRNGDFRPNVLPYLGSTFLELRIFMQQEPCRATSLKI